MSRFGDPEIFLQSKVLEPTAPKPATSDLPTTGARCSRALAVSTRRSRPSSRPRNVPNRRFNNFQHIGRAGRLDGALNTERPRPRSPIVKF